jgi:hypothetical protein
VLPAAVATSTPSHTSSVDQHADVGGLVELTQQGNLVDRQRLRFVTRLGDRHHAQRVQFHDIGLVQPFLQFVLAKAVHQEPDEPDLHAVNRQPGWQEPVQGTQHEAVSAERDDDIGLVEAALAVRLTQRRHGLLGLGRVAGHEMDIARDVHAAVSSASWASARTATAMVA